ncbi:IQ domain-containing protein IQM2 [Sesamum angolense]|uniref:IQ domain-containing protein IQM2 n=1 Tax=Sesamum angolense TaxID=2727404 RepID=A0AAE1XCH9_9LAMI|nr:IQ domain-containing protein IQM2 [Sesamum angolense]
MGVAFSCPFALHCDLENGFESVVGNSIGIGDDEQNTTVQSISFEDRGSEPAKSQSLDSQQLFVDGSVRSRPTKSRNIRFADIPAEEKYMCQDMVCPLPVSGSFIGRIPHSPIFHPSSPKHEAAIKLQKVYKSFRTRRKLADCAVLIEQSWWKLLDFAELKHSSISFFNIDKHETAVSRWSRARTRAAKVGKGLSKNGKAQKLALQHWLEAIDPRHRYGHNLHFYYVKWLNSQSKEPFFYWLDIGEGKEVNLIEKCSRSKLQQQCIKYLGPMERKAYEVAVEDGKLFYKQTGEFLDTTEEPKGSKWIFVLSTSKTLYVGKKKKGSFQHSSFLAGGATLAAGRIVAEKGVLKAVWPHSGHYRPTPENFQDFISFIRENNVDLTDVKLESTDDEEEESTGKKGGAYLRSNSSEEDLAEKDRSETEENDCESTSNKFISGEEETAASVQAPKSSCSNGFSQKLSALQIPSKDDLLVKLMSQEIAESSNNSFPLGSPIDGDETAEEAFASGPECRRNSMSSDNKEIKEETIPEESIFQRINSHKETNSYQLGKQLSCKWSTGAGPRISCLRDYPSGLQCHALEQVKLSPRSKRRLILDFPSRASTPTSSSLSRSSSRHPTMDSSPVKRITSSSF